MVERHLCCGLECDVGVIDSVLLERESFKNFGTFKGTVGFYKRAIYYWKFTGEIYLLKVILCYSGAK